LKLFHPAACRAVAPSAGSAVCVAGTTVSDPPFASLVEQQGKAFNDAVARVAVVATPARRSGVYFVHQADAITAAANPVDQLQARCLPSSART
jgi:hypothetical protein